MAKERACKKCKTIYKGTVCPKCGSEEHSDTFKGKIIVLDPEQSEIAKRINTKEKGEYAIKL